MQKRVILIGLVCVMLFAGCAKKEAPSKGEEVTEEPKTPETIETTENAEVGGVTEQTDVTETVTGIVFEGTTTEGDVLTNACFEESKLTMVNVWATYCNPCLNEMPDLGEIANSYEKSEFQIIGIISDVMEGGAPEQLEYAKELISQTNATYTHMLLNESVYLNLLGNIEAVPTTFFVNQKGEILETVVGAQSKESWEEMIRGWLEKL